uniref:hypothetical protein n=1 Tax=Prevotella sp. TaxID=59823 RepID=UPI004028A7C8
MIRGEITLDRYEWSVTCFIGYDEEDVDEICNTLEVIGCDGDALFDARRHLAKDSDGRGLTYSNVRLRQSVVAIGRSPSHASMANTIGHELFHVVAHVCGKDGIELQGEEPCYIIGELCEKITKLFMNG